MASSSTRFAALVPTALVAWEVGAGYARHRRPKEEARPVEGSFEWQVESKASTGDLVLTRHLQRWRQGPLRWAALLAAPGPYDSVGAIVVDKGGNARVLEADIDGSVSLRPLPSKMRDADEIIIRPLAWPRDDRDKIEGKANVFATKAILECGPGRQQHNAVDAVVAWRAAADERFAPAWQSRNDWPAVQADQPLPVKLQRAVSPSATLVLELYASVGLIPPQHRGRPLVASDFAPDNDPPLRKGARFATPVPIREANLRETN